jgi:hypothetical protein
MEAAEIKGIAEKCELFKTLDDEELDLLLFYGEQKIFASGATVYKTEKRPKEPFA